MYKSLLVLGAILTLTACKNGGDLTLEPGARPNKVQGSPYVQVNQGGKALVVESGQTASTGVHGWISVQAVKSTQMTNAGGTTKIILNKTQAVQ